MICCFKSTRHKSISHHSQFLVFLHSSLIPSRSPLQASQLPPSSPPPSPQKKLDISANLRRHPLTPLPQLAITSRLLLLPRFIAPPYALPLLCPVPFIPFEYCQTFYLYNHHSILIVQVILVTVSIKLLDASETIYQSCTARTQS